MTDGWEYYAAKDLNIKAVPYPASGPSRTRSTLGRRLRPGQLYDFDGDGLTTREEYRAWRITGSSFIASKAGGLDLESPLGYSDGTKFSRAARPRRAALAQRDYGLPNPTQPFPAYVRLPDDAAWRDQERDADGDGLNNRVESARGPSNNGWWKSFWANDKRFAPPIEPWGDEVLLRAQSPGPGFRPAPVRGSRPGRPRRRRRFAARRRGRPGQRRLEQHHGDLRDRQGPRRQRQAPRLVVPSWCTPGRPDDQLRRRHVGGQPVQPVRAESRSRTCYDYKPRSRVLPLDGLAPASS